MDTDHRLLLTHDGLRELGIPYSRTQLWRRMRDGTFPAAVRVGENRIAWRKAEIVAWINGLERNKQC